MLNEDLYEALIRALPIPISLWRQTSDADPASWTLLGASGATEALFDQNLHQRVGERLDAIFETGALGSVRSRLRLLGQPLHQGEVNVQSWPVSDDCVAMVFEPDRAEPGQPDLAFSSLRFQALLERASDGVFVRRQDRLVYVNPALLSLLGYDSPDELVGRSVLTFIHPDQHALLSERIRATDRGQGSEPSISVRCVRRDGQSIWLDGAGMPAKYQNEWAYLVLVRDVTARREEELALRVARESLGARLGLQAEELARARLSVQSEAEKRKLLEEQLRHAQKMDAVGSLAGGIAHDFNNLLSVVLAHASVLSRSFEADDPRLANIQEVLSAGQRAADLTKQLLAVSRRQVLEPRLVDINSLVGRMISMLSRLVGEHISISCVTAPDLQAARIDPTQLEQVLLNLVVNARDAMPGGGQLSIRTSNVELVDPTHQGLGMQPGAHVMICVSDTGVGMDSATRARIFEPFFTTKSMGEGTGLGLSTAHGIVHQSGGAIHVDSAPGQGSSFSVYFPGAGRLEEPPAPTPPRAPRTGRETVLLVEDAAAVRNVFRQILTRAGYRVLVACDGAEAWRIVQSLEEPLHLLLSDVVMPNMGGPELAARLLSVRPDVRILLLSGYSEHDQLPSAAHFLAKPCTDVRLLDKVREVLESALPVALDGGQLGAGQELGAATSSPPGVVIP
jgi:PAS domain S-box-containing protein